MPGTRQFYSIGSTAVAVTTMLMAAPLAALAQNIAAGEVAFRNCAPCHGVGPGAVNKVGPELNGLDGRKAGTAAGFNSSDAAKNSGITWNEATFKEFVRDPRAKIPGTRMFFPGIKDEKVLGDLWAYVSQFGKDGNIKK